MFIVFAIHLFDYSTLCWGKGNLVAFGSNDSVECGVDKGGFERGDFEFG